jgi:uncharacterized membrane protein
VRPLSLGLSLAGLLYPLALYFLIGWVPAGLLLVVPLSLVAGRIALSRGTPMLKPFVPILIAVAAITLVLAIADRETALKAYPILMGAGMAAAFGRSLLSGPTLIESFASLREPVITPEMRVYMRKVTWVWFVFLIVNCGISVLTLVSGRMDLWTLYNGLISYLLMGALFLGERLVRPA